MKIILSIAIGGALGAVSRFFISCYIEEAINAVMPIGTLFVNITGSFLLGLLIYFFEGVIASDTLEAALLIGFLGSYTTFSAYSLQTVNLFKEGQMGLAFTNILLHNVLSLVTVCMGMLLANAILNSLK